MPLRTIERAVKYPGSMNMHAPDRTPIATGPSSVAGSSSAPTERERGRPKENTINIRIFIIKAATLFGVSSTPLSCLFSYSSVVAPTSSSSSWRKLVIVDHIVKF
ncbi:hypothetical protein RND71_012402 [Anisodus tanguticus]|uniref:Uncharacterized protein n=1 Tax=Anisodus tanguticus TaxID=243964 RepID=A0AAE1SEJ8_9SOLA|nr:hypothetical protein RND71_012402 [Anisodus tanguticus]